MTFLESNQKLLLYLNLLSKLHPPIGTNDIPIFDIIFKRPASIDFLNLLQHQNQIYQIIFFKSLVNTIYCKYGFTVVAPTPIRMAKECVHGIRALNI